jgi:AraC-like DNA-binding protein
VLDACGELGFDVDAILDEVGLDRQLVFDPDARLPAQQADAIWAAAFRIAGDPALALHAAEALPFGAYRVLDFVVANAPDVREALGRVARYFSIVDPRGQLELTGKDPSRFGFRSALGQLPPPAEQYTLAAVVTRVRVSAGFEVPFEAVEFTFPAPDDVTEYERIFRCEVRFARAGAAVVVPESTLALDIPGSDAALSSVLENHADRLVRELPPLSQGIAARLSRVLQDELRGGNISAAHISARLGVSERTLQRRLLEEETTYAAVLEGMRRSAAEKYLQERDVSLSEIAWLLGFSEQSSFARAFKRWTGQSPGAWRCLHTRDEG